MGLILRLKREPLSLPFRICYVLAKPISISSISPNFKDILSCGYGGTMCTKCEKVTASQQVITTL